MSRNLFLAVLALLLSTTSALAEHYRVYLIGGQSNANGRGDAAKLTEPLASPQRDVRFYWHRTQATDNVGHLAEDQWIDLAAGSGHGKTKPVYPKEFGLELSFGRAMADAYPDQQIAIIKYSHGGSNLHTQWAEGGAKYQTFVATTKAALAKLTSAGDTYELRGMVWQQGEADAGRKHADQYNKNLTDLVERVRKDICNGEPLPFIIGGLSDSQNPTIKIPGEPWYIARQAQEAVAKNTPKVGFVNTDGFSSRVGEAIHFNHDALVTLGKAHAKEMIRIENGNATGSRPNIILLMGDDHGWDETGYNGHPHLKTPVLDEMAATGLRMDRFYSAHPSCSPTRGSVMTGRHPVRYGTFAPNYSMRPEEITIAQLLNKAGYACGHFGKWHLGPVKSASPTSPGAMGFGEWLSHDNFFELNPTLSRNGGPPQKFDGEGSEIIIAETIEFVKKTQQNDQPFFAVVWFGSPHEPYSGLDDDLALYENLPTEYSDKEVKVTSNKTGRSTKRPLRDVLKERYAEITAMDRSIGQLRQWLKQENLRDNTLIWYCGDNGTPGDGIVTSPFRGRKGTMYEGGIRVPGVIEWPSRITRPDTSDVNSVTSDMLPTLCNLTGITLPDRPLDGIDLTPMIDGQMNQRPGVIGFWSYDAGPDGKNKPYIAAELQRGTTPLVKLMGDIPTRVFRNFHHPQVEEQDFAGARVLMGNRYKLIVQNKRHNEPKIELFDVRDDPAETKNLINAQPNVAAAMQSELRQWQQSVLQSLTTADYER